MAEKPVVEKKKPAVVIPTAEQLEAAAAAEASAVVTVPLVEGDGVPPVLAGAPPVDGDGVPPVLAGAPPDAVPLPEDFNADALATAIAATSSLDDLAQLAQGYARLVPAHRAVDPEMAEQLLKAFNLREAKLNELAAIPVRGNDPARLFRVEATCVPRIDGYQVTIGAGETVRWTSREVDQAVRQGVKLLPLAEENDPVEQVAMSIFATSRTIAMARGEGFVPSWHDLPEEARKTHRDRAREIIEKE